MHETLGEFKGKLQSDGYSAYTAYLKKNTGVELVSCLAHIRRKFFDAQKNHRELAELALNAIQYLYRIEGVCRTYDCTPEQRLKIRQRYARPAYDGLLEWVDHHQKNNLTKGNIGKALGYAKNHLPRLRHYLDDGRVEIDNNQIENKVRRLVLGRKNYMFAGSNKGAQRAAMMYSFFASCKEHQVNPRDWLQDVLLRIGNHKVNRLEELLPGEWVKREGVSLVGRLRCFLFFPGVERSSTDLVLSAQVINFCPGIPFSQNLKFLGFCELAFPHVGAI